jgi:hypothetical protein
VRARARGRRRESGGRCDAGAIDGAVDCPCGSREGGREEERGRARRRRAQNRVASGRRGSWAGCNRSALPRARSRQRQCGPPGRSRAVRVRPIRASAPRAGVQERKERARSPVARGLRLRVRGLRPRPLSRADDAQEAAALTLSERLVYVEERKVLKRLAVRARRCCCCRGKPRALRTPAPPARRRRRALSCVSTSNGRARARASAHTHTRTRAPLSHRASIQLTRPLALVSCAQDTRPNDLFATPVAFWCARTLARLPPPSPPPPRLKARDPGS